MIASARAEQSTSPLVSVDEATDLFPGQWIVMKVTAFDESGNPTHGQVVAHDLSSARATRKLGKLLSAAPTANDRFYLFHGYHHVRTGDEMRRVLADAARAESVNACRRW